MIALEDEERACITASRDEYLLMQLRTRPRPPFAMLTYGQKRRIDRE